MAEEKTQRELYQLIANENGKEIVIELNNDNKKNRGTLELLDSGTSRFESRAHLAWYLNKAGKISTPNVEFAIKYNHNGPKYMPVIYYDGEIYAITKDKDKFLDSAFFLLKKIEVALNEPGFLRFVINLNEMNRANKNSGNYINQRLINAMIEYYNAYIVTHDIDANKADLQHEMLTEILQYKQFRTLREFYNKFFGEKDFKIEPGQAKKR